MKVKGYSQFPGFELHEGVPIEANLQQIGSKPLLFSADKKKRKTKQLSLFTWLRRIIGISLFIGAAYECFIQIHELTSDYLRHEVIESSADYVEDFVQPPNFSFCFDILSLINSSELLKYHPEARAQLNEIRAKDSQYKDWTESAIIHDYTKGPDIVFNLTVAEIYDLLPRFNSSITDCRYLSRTLKLDKCDGSYFTEYFFNQMVCNEFIWHPVGEIPSEPISFPYDGIKIPGFQNTRFLALRLDLGTLPNITVMSVMAHSPKEVSWDPEASSMETYPDYGETKIYGLSYHKTSRTSLEFPFQSNCTDFRKTPYKSRQDCLQTCSVQQFIRQTQLIPKYAIIRKFDDNKILYNYKERERYQGLIQNLSEHCNKICGTSDCYSEEFTLTVLYSPRQSIHDGKQLIIHIYPPAKPDTAISTAPSLTFQYYFASIGGTLGIWFGFSFYSCLIFIFDTTPKIAHYFQIFCKRSSNKVKSDQS